MPRPEKSRKAVETDKRMDPDPYNVVKQLKVAQDSSPSSGMPRPEKSRKAVETDKRMDPDPYNVVKQLKVDIAEI
ncbi:hypothetical protein EOD39_1771 [Acipenser ruthenus]|uniref:Uncharacterized protein n=1 Tax=Acipenser ruthenus TaxID=7906 RepID=A0A444U841_ACIRT|nr:hypothetical protein EOD39_1771 [Acipenser ruthenus]